MPRPAPSRPERRPSAGETGSIEALTHGIFAITMTLLILELRVPESESDGALWGALTDLGPSIAGYVFGFVYLMGVWMSLREFLRQLSGITTSVTVLLLVVIGTVSLTPFTVATMSSAFGHSDDLGVAVRLMAIVVGLSFAISAVAAKVAHHQGLVPDNDWFRMPWPRALLLSGGPAAVGFVLSFLNPWLGLAVMSVDIVLGIADFGIADPAPAPE